MPMPFAPCKTNSIGLKLCVFRQTFQRKEREFTPFLLSDQGNLGRHQCRLDRAARQYPAKVQTCVSEEEEKDLNAD